MRALNIRGAAKQFLKGEFVSAAGDVFFGWEGNGGRAHSRCALDRRGYSSLNYFLDVVVLKLRVRG